MDNKTFVGVLFTVLFFSFITFKVGKSKGFTEGALKTKASMEESYKEDVDYYKQQANDGFSSGMEYGKVTAERDCRDKLSINDALCKEDLKKAFYYGKLSAIRYVETKCGQK